MHIYFSGIGGTGIGPLALIAKQAGYTVSGSDKQDSQYINYLKKHGVTDIHIGQTEAEISSVHQKNPIDWYVYSSAVVKENEFPPELNFIKSHEIKHSKRDEFLNHILQEKRLKLLAVAGTHGKSTTTAMAIWLLQNLHVPISYSVGAKIAFGEMGHYDPSSEYFIYECDEYDRNFLSFHPHMALISGIAWDHHEIFPTQDNYYQAFRDFLQQSEHKTMWREDFEKLTTSHDESFALLDTTQTAFSSLQLSGEVNRRNAWLVINAVQKIIQQPLDQLVAIMNEFPGLSRRMELLRPNLYTDYAHTPEKILGAMNTAREIAQKNQQKLAVVYEPLTNRRMHFTRNQHADIFTGADAIYWVPSYLAREDPGQIVLTPRELIESLNPKLREIAIPMELDEKLKAAIESHLTAGDMVIALSGGGGGSLDEWLRKEFTS